MAGTIEIKQVSSREELNAVVDVIWAALDGVDPSHQIMYPTFDRSPGARAVAIAESKERLWAEHTADKNSTWIYAQAFPEEVNLAEWRTDRYPMRVPLLSPGVFHQSLVVGGCQWRIYTENPFPDGKMEPIVPYWWPAGVGRQFAAEVVKQLFEPRVAWMARPHSGVSLMSVRPDWQRRGIGTQLMEWGLERTDQLGLESYIEATPQGQALYESCGYRAVRDVWVDMKKHHSRKRSGWEELEERKLPIGYTATWRPVHGVWESGEPAKTWEDRTKTTEP